MTSKFCCTALCRLSAQSGHRIEGPQRPLMTQCGRQTDSRQRLIVLTTTNGAKACSRSVGRDSPEPSMAVQAHPDDVARSSRSRHGSHKG